jgi:flagellum-specific ATP synthase
LKQTPGDKPASDAYADLANALKAAAGGQAGMRQRG